MLYSPSMQLVVTAVETALISALVSFLVVQGLKELLALFNVDLTGQAAAVTAVIVTAIVALLNGLLIQIPTSWVPIAEELQRLLDLLIGALGPFGLFRIYKGIKTGK